jgi:hypothetical protein
LDADDHTQYDRVDGTRHYIKNLLTTQGDLLIRGANGLERLPIGSAGQVLKSQGAGANPVWDDVALATFECIVSDNIRHSNDAEKRIMGLSDWTKAKEIKLNEDLEVVRIKFSLRCSVAGYYVRGRIYKNGEPIGTVRETSSGSYVEFSEDFTGFVANDLIQVYLAPGVTSPVGNDAYCANFRLCFDRNVVKISNRTLVTKLALNAFETAPTNTIT